MRSTVLIATRQRLNGLWHAYNGNVISERARAVTRLQAALCVCVVRTRDVCQTRPRPPRQPLGGCGLVAGPPELPLPPKHPPVAHARQLQVGFSRASK